MATIEDHKDYEAEIVALRAQRADAISKVIAMTSEVESMLNSLASDTGNLLVSWNDLLETEIGVALQVNEKVSFVKYLHDGYRQGFKVFLEAGGTFGIQQHDCLEETLIIKGNLIEAFRDNKEYTEGQTVTYVTCQLHKPYCTVDSVYNVIFSNKCKRDGCEDCSLY